MKIDVTLTKTPSQKQDENNLGFGKHFTDHMFTMDYSQKDGWHNAKITPYAPIEMDPASMVLHYGQAVFEGLKAYRTGDHINLFRPLDNFVRMNISNERLCMPPVNGDDVVCALKELINIDKDFIPQKDGTSLYIRPFIFSTDAALGVRPSDTYKFVIILSPSGSYYQSGLDPVKIFIEDDFVRAVKGGVGFTKASANYAISLKGQMKAKELGYSQVLWLDGIHRKYIEEVGAMNVFFKIDGEVVTPSLEGSILPGITRDSVIKVLRSLGLKVSERQISVDELVEAYNKGLLEEAFGTGTAAVISPIGELFYKGTKMTLNKGKIGDVSQKLYDTITGIQYGKITDDFGWITQI